MSFLIAAGLTVVTAGVAAVGIDAARGFGRELARLTTFGQDEQ